MRVMGMREYAGRCAVANVPADRTVLPDQEVLIGFTLTRRLIIAKMPVRPMSPAEIALRAQEFRKRARRAIRNVLATLSRERNRAR